MLLWVTMSVIFGILVLLPSNKAGRSDLHFDEDTVPSTSYPVWLKRFQDLQIKAATITNVLSTSSSMMSGSVVSGYGQLFEEFVSLFERGYQGDAVEYDKRFQIFMQSLRRQQLLTRKETSRNGTAKYGMNKFSDWTPLEFQTLLTVQPSGGHFEGITTFSGSPEADHLKSACSVSTVKPLPNKIDWKSKASKIKNQGTCGSCWAFVGSEQIETYWAIKTGSVAVERSPQEMLSCSPSLGCEGGNTCVALEWLVKTGLVLDTEKDYPYEEQDSPCRPNVNKTISGPRVQAVCGCQRLVGSEKLMLRVLNQKGPLSVNVDAVQWHDYVGGIIQHHCTNKNMNHAVQLIGYDLVSEPVPYWLARNQWGRSFGEDGYVRIKYGENMCGVAEQPSFIQVH